MLELIAADADNFAGRGWRKKLYGIQRPGMPGAFAEAPKISEDFMDLIALDYSVANFGMNLMIRTV